MSSQPSPGGASDATSSPLEELERCIAAGDYRAARAFLAELPADLPAEQRERVAELRDLIGSDRVVVIFSILFGIFLVVVSAIVLIH